MAKIDFVHYYELPLEEYVRMIMEPTEEEIGDLTELPNLQEREELERYEDDKIIRTVARNFAVGFIPPMVRQYLKPHMLSWLEHSTYDKQGRFWDWDIEPHFFKNIVTCKGRMSLHADGDRTKRITKGVLEVRVPMIGRLAEKVVLEHLGINFEAELKMFHENLQKQREKREKF